MAEGPTSMSLGQQGLGVPEVWPLGCEVARRGDETQIGIQGHEGHRDGRFLLHELRIQWFIAHATKALYDMMIQRQVIEG